MSYRRHLKAVIANNPNQFLNTSMLMHAYFFVHIYKYMSNVLCNMCKLEVYTAYTYALEVY